ncbi:MAG: peptidoglycan editing factor PgeF [Alphaproteobacteria bacterium]|nr:peptidoglycan editing factor PgeF [Alphaproteobacteria bacterium]
MPRIPFISHPDFAHDDSIVHGFFSRLGGVSKGIYAELNCGLMSGDDPSAIITNRARVMQALGVFPEELSMTEPEIESHLHSVSQIHSSKVSIVDNEWPQEKPPEADALVTDVPGEALGILTADCAPVLFADLQCQIIGAAHAGWRGALSGVLENTVDAMIRCGAKREHIRAIIGPCIHQASYEMGPEVLDQFLDISSDYHVFFKHSSKKNHFMFDLPAFVRYRLDDCGTTSIFNINIDTYANEEYFSYRRNTHRQEKGYGRLISAIALKRG